MFLTTKGRYAVMAMVELASSGDGPTKLSILAERQNIDLCYLEQIFSQLKNAQLVRAVRGPGGGYVLQRPSEQIKVSEVMLAVNEQIRITRCENDNKVGCMKNGAFCVTHAFWAALEKTMYDFMDGVTLSDICSRKLNKVEYVEVEERRGYNPMQSISCQ